MENEFVDYNLALRIKQLGFDKPCLAFYQVENFEEKPCGVDDKDEYLRTGFATCKNSEIPEHFTAAPTWQSAFAWFREKYKLNGEINHLPNVEKYGVITADMTIKPKDLSKNENFERGFKVTNNFAKYNTYEKAQEACLEKLIEIVEQKLKSE